MFSDSLQKSITHICWVPSRHHSVLLHTIFSHGILASVHWNGDYYYPYFVNEKTEAQSS